MKCVLFPLGSPGVDGMVGATGKEGPRGFPGGLVIVKNECENNNGGCDHICVDTYDGYCCMCRKGYHLIQLEQFNCKGRKHILLHKQSILLPETHIYYYLD